MLQTTFFQSDSFVVAIFKKTAHAEKAFTDVKFLATLTLEASKKKTYTPEGDGSIGTSPILLSTQSIPLI